VDDEVEGIRARKRAELEGAIGATDSVVPMRLTDANFWEIVKGNRVVLVDFWAEWCGPCHRIAPTVEAIAKDYAGRLTVGKLNTDENRRTAETFGIHSIPTLLVFKDGELVDSVVGAVPRPFLEETLQRWL
jgi:thioredoxin 1